MSSPRPATSLFLGQYTDVDALIAAVKCLRDEPEVTLEAFTPFPVDSLTEELRLNSSPMPAVLLTGGVVGAASMYALQYWINVYAYPLNIGGRPLHSWPSFIPATFEVGVLLASLAGMFGLFYLCGLPRLHHPLFEIEAFKRASSDGFFLALQSRDSEQEKRLRSLLRDTGAVECWEVQDA